MGTRRGVVGLLAVAALVVGCADRRITLKYGAADDMPPLRAAHAVTVYSFADRRGSEGDGDPRRVGGIYGGYGNRLSKVMVDAPFMGTLVDAIVAGLKARGVDAVGDHARTFQLGLPGRPGLALTGELRNFSTEARFTNSAHISGIVRLYDARGALLVEKPISVRERQEFGGAGVFTPVEYLEQAMNVALARFVKQVVTDPDIAAAISGTSGAGGSAPRAR